MLSIVVRSQLLRLRKRAACTQNHDCT